MALFRLFGKTRSALVRRDSTITITTLDATRLGESRKNSRSSVAQSGNVFHAKFLRSQESIDFFWLFQLCSQILARYVAIYTRISTLNWAIICKDRVWHVLHCREKSKKAIRNVQVEIFTTSCVRRDWAEIERERSLRDCKKYSIPEFLNSDS